MQNGKLRQSCHFSMQWSPKNAHTKEFLRHYFADCPRKGFSFSSVTKIICIDNLSIFGHISNQEALTPKYFSALQNSNYIYYIYIYLHKYIKLGTYYRLFLLVQHWTHIFVLWLPICTCAIFCGSTTGTHFTNNLGVRIPNIIPSSLLYKTHQIPTL